MARSRPPDDGRYVVQDGEWCGSIAMRFGFADWMTDVWMLDENSALRDLRGDPRTLAPGDVLYVPPWQPHDELRPTGARHAFRMKVPTEVIRIRVLDDLRQPLANEPYALALDAGDGGGGTFKQAATATDGDGVLTEAIPSTAVGGRLVMTNSGLSFDLAFGFLWPVDPDDAPASVRGAQQRLATLGFDPGPADGTDGPLTRAAVADFQQFCWQRQQDGDPTVPDAGPIDGILGPVTLGALVKFYGC